MKNNLLLLFFCICFSGISNKLIAQPLEVGIGVSPLIYKTTNINTYTDFDGPTLNSADFHESEIIPMFNLNVGMYFSLLPKSDHFSPGILYQAITYVGVVSGSSSRFAYGVDMPLMACLRFGYTASNTGNDKVGVGFGGGYMVSLLGFDGKSLYDKRAAFTPAFQGFLIFRDFGGFQFTSNLFGADINYESNTGPIPKSTITTYHLTFYKIL